MQCWTISLNISIFLRDQRAEDVKEDFEERTESELRTPHEARGTHNILMLLIGINTQQWKLGCGSPFYIKDRRHLVGSITASNKSLLFRILLVYNS